MTPRELRSQPRLGYTSEENQGFPPRPPFLCGRAVQLQQSHCRSVRETSLSICHGVDERYSRRDPRWYAETLELRHRVPGNDRHRDLRELENAVRHRILDETCERILACGTHDDLGGADPVGNARDGFGFVAKLHMRSKRDAML